MPPKRLFSQIENDESSSSDSDSTTSPLPYVANNLEIEFHSLHVQSPNRQQRLAIVQQQVVPIIIESAKFQFGVEYELFKTFAPASVFEYYYHDRINFEEEEWREFFVPLSTPFKKHSHRNVKSMKKKVSFKNIEKGQDSDDEEFFSQLLNTSIDSTQNDAISQENEEEEEIIVTDNDMIVDVQSKSYNRPQYTVFSQKKKKEAFGSVFIDLKMLRDNNYSILPYIIKYVTFVTVYK